MKEMRDPVIAAALEFESAALATLQAQNEKPVQPTEAWLLRFADAVAVIQAMPEDDFSRGIAYLTNRGRIPQGAWPDRWPSPQGQQANPMAQPPSIAENFGARPQSQPQPQPQR